MGGGGRDGHRHCCLSPEPPVGGAVALLCGGGGGAARHCCCSSRQPSWLAPWRVVVPPCGIERLPHGLASWGLAPLSRSPLDLGMWSPISVAHPAALPCAALSPGTATGRFSGGSSVSAIHRAWRLSPEFPHPACPVPCRLCGGGRCGVLPDVALPSRRA